MKTITLLRLLALTVFSILCTGCAGEPDFLKKFADSEADKALYKQKITPQDLDILLATNEVNEPIFNVGHTYYYGFYKKMEDGHYLVSYRDSYQPTYRFTNRLAGWYDYYYCIYCSKTNTVVSKLKVQSTDPVNSYCEEKDGIYTIKSQFFKFVPVEAPCTIEFQRDSALSKYRIKNNRFVQL